MKNGAATSSRDGDGCTFDAGSATGALTVRCARHRSATLVYVFTTRHPVRGTAMAAVSAYGWGHVWESVTASGRSVRLTVTVRGSVTLNTVSVEYYG